MHVATEVKEKVSLVSLGCPKNLVDAEVMLGYLAQQGYEVTTDEHEADIIIVNTCSFIKEAKQESVDTILDLADRKQDGRCQLLVVTGCLPQRYQEELATELPEVDIFVGTGDYPRIAEIIAEKRGIEGQIRYTGDPNYLFDPEMPRLQSSPYYYSYLKIAEGCSNCCSYCVIPSLRGGFRSRPVDQLLKEAQALVGRGVKELNLIAQDITGYGRDLPGGAGRAHGAAFRRRGDAEEDGAQHEEHEHQRRDQHERHAFGHVRQQPQAQQLVRQGEHERKADTDGHRDHDLHVGRGRLAEVQPLECQRGADGREHLEIRLHPLARGVQVGSRWSNSENE